MTRTFSLRRGWGGAVCAALLALLALFTPSLGAAPAHADTVSAGTAPPIRFVAYNICGNACSSAQYDNQRRIDTVIAQASTATWGADDIGLAEVCRGQFDAILSGLSSQGFNGSYAPTISGKSTVCGGQDYGVAILVKGPVLTSTTLTLTVGGESEPIAIPCVKTYTQGRANWACAVHLYWSDATLRLAEAKELAAQANAWEESGLPVVLLGDFNDTPRSAMASNFYDGATQDGGTGLFTEGDQTDKDNYDTSVCTSASAACRSGAPTFNARKIDYVFLSTRDFAGAKEDVLPLDPQVSDHRMVRGAASWSDCGPTGTAGGLFRRDSTGVLLHYAGKPDGNLAAPCKVGYGWEGMRMVVRDGSDLLAVDSSQILWRYPADPATGSYSGSTRVQVGTGWQSMNALVTPGDFDGDGRPDLIARDTAGTLWLYPGNGSGGYLARKSIGTGWQIYTQLISPGDFDGDGKSDLIGLDAAGDLWLYRGNGTGGYAARTQIGYGWQNYTSLVAAGDVNGDGRADLLARDTAGDLWAYLGDGAGSYQPRTKVGYNYPDGELLF